MIATENPLGEKNYKKSDKKNYKKKLK